MRQPPGQVDRRGAVAGRAYQADAWTSGITPAGWGVSGGGYFSLPQASLVDPAAPALPPPRPPPPPPPPPLPDRPGAVHLRRHRAVARRGHLGQDPDWLHRRRRPGVLRPEPAPAPGAARRTAGRSGAPPAAADRNQPGHRGGGAGPARRRRPRPGLARLPGHGGIWGGLHGPRVGPGGTRHP